MATVKCLSCGEPIEIEFKPYKGDFVECEHCGMEFEIVSVTPLKITWAEFEDDMEYEEDEDFDEFEDDFDEDDDDDFDDDDDY
ncbi:MAG: hypothetical protein HPY85_11760 [Anaerolineae bacterium]|jgi:lysine biosynthesis protein LysW|nr:hypothetical protein [Anaerolineae bacterium]